MIIYPNKFLIKLTEWILQRVIDMKLLTCLVASLQLCWAAHINANWLLTAMFVRDRHCFEIAELIELNLVSEADLVPRPKLLKKGYAWCKEKISHHEFEKITDDESLFYSLIEIVSVHDLDGLLHDLSGKVGISIEILSKRAFLVSCATGNVPILDQVVHLQTSRIINLGFVLACSRNHLPTMQYLLNHVTPELILAERSMRIACILGNKPIVSFLLASFELDESKFFVAAAHGGNLEIVQLLMKDKGFNLNNHNHNNICEALQWAVNLKHTNIVEYFIEQDSTFKPLAFRKACKHNHIVLVKMLLVDDRDLDVRRGFNKACQNGHLEIAKMLMETGRTNVNSDTLYYAAHSGNIELVSWVLQQPDVDVNTKMEHGTLFSKLVEDEIPLCVLELIIKHDHFAIDTLLSAFYSEDSRRLLLLPVVHIVLLEHKGDVMMRALSCEATIKGLLPLFCHPCICIGQISVAAHILEVDNDPRIMDKLHLIMACKAGQFDRCVELCLDGDIRALVEVGVQCSATIEHTQILAHLLKMYHHSTLMETDNCAMMKIDHVVGMCCCLRATSSIRIIWDWFGLQFPLIHDLLSMTRPFQVRVINRELDEPTLNHHLDVVCQHFETVISGMGVHENLVRLACCYRDHFLIMISIYEACPVIPLEYSEEILTTMLINIISL